MRKFSIHGTEEGNTTSIKLDEIAILADPDTLLKIGEFIIKTAHVMKGYEVDYSHLQDEVSDFDSKNNINLGGICLVAGLGGKENRNGTPSYYYSEPIVVNEAKAVAPFLMAFTEILRLKEL